MNVFSSYAKLKATRVRREKKNLFILSELMTKYNNQKQKKKKLYVNRSMSITSHVRSRSFMNTHIHSVFRISCLF